MKVNTKAEYRKRRHYRLRNKIRGSRQRPRMSVFMSNQHIYVQFIDDDAGVTLAACSTMEEGFRDKKSNQHTAKEVGALAAKRLIEQGIETVIFDRGGFTYEGNVKTLADAAREAGLKF